MSAPDHRFTRLLAEIRYLYARGYRLHALVDGCYWSRI